MGVSSVWKSGLILFCFSKSCWLNIHLHTIRKHFWENSILNRYSEKQETPDYWLLNKSQRLLGRVGVRKYVCKGNVLHQQPMFGNSKSVGFYFLEEGAGIEGWEWLDWNTMRFKPVGQRSESRKKLRDWEKGWPCGTINKRELKCCRWNVIRLQNCN